MKRVYAQDVRTPEFYLQWHDSMWIGGDKGGYEIKCRSVRLVKTRKPHLCAACCDFKGMMHGAGTSMVADHALVEGKFGTCYTCLPCIEAWAKECDPYAPDVSESVV